MARVLCLLCLAGGLVFVTWFCTTWAHRIWKIRSAIVV